MPPRFDDAALGRLRGILGRRAAMEIVAPQHRRACVLLPIIPDGDRWVLLFSRRSDQLQAHRGQIAFPGGAAEPDERLEETVVREAQEEVGIPAGRVELIGRLDDLVTNSGFLVAPFVGVIHGRVDYVLQESEVVEVFEVPIEALLDPALPEVRHVAFRGGSYPAYFYPYGRHEIWGLTGRILKAFLDLVWLTVPRQP